MMGALTERLRQTMAPTTVTLMPTYRCSAACPNCCLSCSPRLRQRIPQDRLLRYLGTFKEEFPSLKVVCFSGGEPFLIGRDLDDAVGEATLQGFATRCVTNAYWATSPEGARRRLKSLREGGLSELNISTGDEHQLAVPFDSVVNAVIAALQLDMQVALAVETATGASFSLRDALTHPRLKRYLKRNSRQRANMVFLPGMWVTWPGRTVCPAVEDQAAPTCASPTGGCSYLFSTFSVTPREEMAACCGIRMERIREMKLGSLRSQDPGALFATMFDDLIKLWLYLDGPRKVLQYAARHDPAIGIAPAGERHQCQDCERVFGDERIKTILRREYKGIVHDVLFRLRTKELLRQGPPMTGKARIAAGGGWR